MTILINKKFDRNSEVFELTLSGPAFSVVHQAKGGGGGGSEAWMPIITVNINLLK